jgi:hypothetical protein
MSNEKGRAFYEVQLDPLHRQFMRIEDPEFPVLSNLQGILGEPILNIIHKMANYYVRGEVLPLFVYAGLPGSGKSTASREKIAQMERLGYELRKSYSYEEALHEVHDPSKDIDYPTWVKTNQLLYDVTMHEQVKFARERRDGKLQKPQFMIMEVPGISLYHPNNIRSKLEKNRDRGVTYLHKLGKIMHKYPMYVFAITGERQARQIAIDHRQNIIQLESENVEKNEDVINAYLWAQALLDSNLKINPHTLIKLLESMAMPHHLATIHKEFDQHKSTFTKRMMKDSFNVFINARREAMGREVTNREAIALVEMLTFNYFLDSLGIPQTRLVNAFNPFKPELQSSFYNQISRKNGASFIEN